MVKTPEDVDHLHPYHPDILETSDVAYSDAANRHNLDSSAIHDHSHCYNVCDSMGIGLINRGYAVTLLQLIMDRPFVAGETHYMQELQASESRVLVDPTWQQFMGIWVRRKELPKVIVGTPEDLVTFVKKAGAKKRYLNYLKADSGKIFYTARHRFDPGHADNYWLRWALDEES